MSLIATRARAAAVVAAVAVAVTLGGCTTPSDPAPTSDTAATTVPEPVLDEATASPVATVDLDPEPEVVVPEHGTVVTTQEEVDAAQAAGLGIYTSPVDERMVVIDPDAPLAEEIIADAKAIGREPSQIQGKDALEADALLNVARQAAKSGGMKPVFVGKAAIYGRDLRLERTRFGVITPYLELQRPGGGAATVEEAIAKAEERIADAPDPSRYQVVVLVD